MKWQTGAISSIISLGFILSIILNLTGISYSNSPDIPCTECYSKIEVNSTYWNVCVEHAKNKTALFKKTATSRTLYINLDKINEIITTNPEIKTDLLVQTIKSRVEFTSNEYGYLRNVKDGDCIIERSKKPSKFYIHGNKEAFQTVKWSFNAEHITIEDINIDPIWLPINEITPIKECRTFTESIRNLIETENCTLNKTSVYLENLTKIKYNVIEFINTTCKIRDIHDFINKTICEVIGYQFNGNIINCKELGYKCSASGSKIIGDSIYDGNGNGECTSGESCFKIDTTDLSIEEDIDTNSIKRVKIEREE